MSERTPGPWTVSPVRTVEGEYMVVGGPGQEFGLIAAVTELADAQAIAALPEIVKALERIRLYARDLRHNSSDGLRAIADGIDRAIDAALLPVERDQLTSNINSQDGK